MSEPDIHETPSSTPNFRTELAAQLAELVPEAIADGKVDVTKLQELLDGDAAEGNERFGLFWPGKKRALRVAQEPTTATLKPDFENSKDWDTTQNVFIEGDNLEVLKILQRHYHGKIKMIYIDPPYNTGKDFVYPDNYKEGVDTYLEWTRQVNENGKKLSTNSESEGRYHSNWLNMMYPRLKLARNLLTRDGHIFVSIDDHELPQLLRVGNEVFGESNFVGTLVWRRRSGSMDSIGNLSADHEYVVVWSRAGAPLNGVARTFEKYTNPDDDPRGPWIADNLSAGKPGGDTYYAVVDPQTGAEYWPPKGRYWPYSSATMAQKIAEGRVLFPSTAGGSPKLKRFANEAVRDVLPVSSWIVSDANSRTQASMQTPMNSSATKRLTSLLGGKYFLYPKPVELVKALLEQGTDSDSIVLDFFAGSGTTAQAVLELNAEDGGERQSILVQLPEPTPVDSLAREAGFSTIPQIARRRIDLAGQELQAATEGQLDTGANSLDQGFRTFVLADSNFSKWRVSSDVDLDELEQRLLGLRDSADDGATPDDLFTEILLKQGFSLTEQIKPLEVAGLDMRAVLQADGDLAVLAYLDERTKPTLDQLRAMVDAIPGGKIIVLEDAFQGDDELKTNLAQLCKSNGVELWTA